MSTFTEEREAAEIQREAERLEAQFLAFKEQELAMLFRSGLRPGAQLLELGCGAGIATRCVADGILGESGAAVGFEVQPHLLGWASTRHGDGARVRFVHGQAEQLPFESDTFDFVYARFYLQRLSCPETAMREALRVLKPGGILCVLDLDDSRLSLLPDAPEFRSLRAILLPALDSDSAGGDKRPWSPALFQKLGLRKVGFETLSDPGQIIDPFLRLPAAKGVEKADGAGPAPASIPPEPGSGTTGVLGALAFFVTRGEKHLKREKAGILVATSEEEKRRVFAFRRKIFLDERGRTARWDHPDPDGFWDDVDRDDKHAQILYIERDGEVVATIRMHWWDVRSGEHGEKSRFREDLFWGIENRVLRIAEIARLAIAPECRGQGLLELFGGYLFCIALQMEIDLVFQYCVPNLTEVYATMGFRGYSDPRDRAGFVIQTDNGPTLPLVFIPSDTEYLERHAPRLYERIKPLLECMPRRLDLDRAREIVRDYPNPRGESPEQVLANAMAAGGRLSSLFEGLTRSYQVRLCRCTLDLPEGAFLVREDQMGEELYLIVRGRVRVMMKDRRDLFRGPGDIVGEMAMFMPDKKRVASLQTTEPTQVLVLGHDFLDTLGRERPEETRRLLTNLCGILARKVIE